METSHMPKTTQLHFFNILVTQSVNSPLLSIIVEYITLYIYMINIYISHSVSIVSSLTVFTS